MRGSEQRDQRSARRRAGIAAGIASTALWLAVLPAGCGQIPTGTDPAVTSPPPAGTPSGTSRVDPSADVGRAEEDLSFSFDDIASYEGGLEVEITGTVAQQATTGMTGAETTNGQMVVVSVLIRNDSTADVDATTALVSATYGAADTEATLVVDPAGGLANAFLGSVTAGEEVTARYGFAIPFSALGHVTVTVDLGDGEHEPVSFAGAIQRDG